MKTSAERLLARIAAKRPKSAKPIDLEAATPTVHFYGVTLTAKVATAMERIRTEVDVSARDAANLLAAASGLDAESCYAAWYSDRGRTQP